MTIPYRIAVLCYLFDRQGRVLLMHRRQEPNLDRYSPIGGKLEQDRGESPTACAIREIEEEAGITVAASDLHLAGIVSEASYEDKGHWLLFCYEVTRPVEVMPRTLREGTLEWHEEAEVENLAIPETDRRILWPLFRKYRGGFFMAHVECAGGTLQWSLEQAVMGPSASDSAVSGLSGDDDGGVARA